MKATFKALALAVSLSMIAGSAFALDTDLTALTTKDAVIDSGTAQVAFTALTQVAATGVEDNLVAIVQISDWNVSYIYIDQTNTGVNNAAVILQDSTNNVDSAAIVQVGAGNRAFINQH